MLGFYQSDASPAYGFMFWCSNLDLASLSKPTGPIASIVATSIGNRSDTFDFINIALEIVYFDAAWYLIRHGTL
jgi:hypothetical protein